MQFMAENWPTVALVFDHIGYGDSEGEIRNFENGFVKMERRDGISFLGTLPFVDRNLGHLRQWRLHVYCGNHRQAPKRHCNGRYDGQHRKISVP